MIAEGYLFVFRVVFVEEFETLNADEAEHLASLDFLLHGTKEKVALSLFEGSIREVIECLEENLLFGALEIRFSF